MLHFTVMNKKTLVVTSKKNKRLKLTKRRICILSAVVQVVSVKVMDNLFFLYQYLISNKGKQKLAINFS